jgi:ribonuclease T2
VTLAPGQSYNVLAKNKDDASHFLIEAPDATPNRRWVAATCGSLAGAGATGVGAASNAAPSGGGAPSTGQKQVFVFAVSWQPEFCVDHQDKKECETETPNGFDATHFTLHGLWPQPKGKQFCGVDARIKQIALHTHDFSQLPEVPLSPPVLANLTADMPGVQSHLERHEWFRHGTCATGASPDSYFATAVGLVDELNKSKVRELFANNIGAKIDFTQIKAAMVESFGAGAGDRVQMHCKDDEDGRMITEFYINVAGNVGDGAGLSQWLSAGQPQPVQCASGEVRPIGQ